MGPFWRPNRPTPPPAIVRSLPAASLRAPVLGSDQTTHPKGSVSVHQIEAGSTAQGASKGVGSGTSRVVRCGAQMSRLRMTGARVLPLDSDYLSDNLI